MKTEVNNNSKLYKWQEECLDAWESEGCRGIVNAVTGSGKTRLAIAAAARLASQYPDLSIRIVAPTIALANQWRQNIIRSDEFAGEKTGFYGGGVRDDADGRIMIYVINSARQGLQKHIRTDFALGRHVLLICDECHRYKSEHNRRIFSFMENENGNPHVNASENESENESGRADPLNFMSLYHSLGLSATPFNNDHDELLINALGREVYKYDFRRAAQEETISRYFVCQVSAGFMGEEAEEYTRLSDAVKKTYGKLVLEYPYLKFLKRDEFLREVSRLAKQADMDPEDPAAAFLILTYQRKEISVLAEARVRCCTELIDRLLRHDRIRSDYRKRKPDSCDYQRDRNEKTRDYDPRETGNRKTGSGDPRETGNGKTGSGDPRETGNRKTGSGDPCETGNGKTDTGGLSEKRSGKPDSAPATVRSEIHTGKSVHSRTETRVGKSVHSRIIVFCERIAQAEEIHRIISRKHGNISGLYHSGMKGEARERVLDDYRNDRIRVLVSCKCLDEGIDVPDASVGIVVSSSAVARQRIQRLGRIVRNSEGKEAASLYYIFIRESLDDRAYLRLEDGEVSNIFDLMYYSSENVFSNDMYEYAAMKILKREEERIISGTAPALSGNVENTYSNIAMMPDFSIRKVNGNDGKDALSEADGTAAGSFGSDKERWKYVAYAEPDHRIKSTRRASEFGRLQELRRCILEGLCMPDYLLDEKALTQHMKNAETVHEKNYYSVMRQIHRAFQTETSGTEI